MWKCKYCVHRILSNDAGRLRPDRDYFCARRLIDRSTKYCENFKSSEVIDVEYKDVEEMKEVNES